MTLARDIGIDEIDKVRLNNSSQCVGKFGIIRKYSYLDAKSSLQGWNFDTSPRVHSRKDSRQINLQESS